LKRIALQAVVTLLLTGMLTSSFGMNAFTADKSRPNATYGPAAVRVVPEMIELGPENVTGEEFTVAIVVEDVTDLAGLDIQIMWNTTYLDYVNHTATVPVEDYPLQQNPSPYGGILYKPILQLKDEANTTAGTYWAAFLTFGGPSFNGSGTVFVMTFKVAYQPQRDEEDVVLGLRFTSTDLARSTAAGGGSIPHDIVHGTVIIYAYRIHDIAITDVTPSETLVGQNYTVFIDVTIENQGDYTETFNVTLQVNTTVISTINDMISAKDDSTTIVFAWDTTGFPCGNYTITAQITLVPGETDTADNIHTDCTITVISFAHDLAIADITSSKTVVGHKFPLNVSLTIENQGGYTETLDVTAYANSTIIDTLTGVTLLSGKSATITFTWNTTGWTKGNYIVNAYVELVPGETDTADNTYVDGIVAVTIPGDVDGDFDVDIYDVVKLCAVYGSKKGDLKYDANCDINSDGEIDIYDVVILSGLYGEKYP
jgi:hypothetical protein